MTTILQTTEADSPGYTRFLAAVPIGTSQAGADVTASTVIDGETTKVLLTLHGQREFDLPGDIEQVTFPDGSTWKPE